MSRGTLKYDHKLGTDRAVCAPSLEAPSHVIAISEAENQQKVDNFRPVYLGNYQHEQKKFVVFEHTTYNLYHGHIHLFRLG